MGEMGILLVYHFYQKPFKPIYMEYFLGKGFFIFENVNLIPYNLFKKSFTKKSF